MPFFVSPDGVRLHYEIEGSGPPLVLHMGAGCDATMWREAGYVEPLSRAYRCVLFDHRGHGPSDHPSSLEANHVDRYAEDVAALAQHLDYSSISFLGWSTGLVVGLKAAQEHPHLLDALVLLGPVARPASADQIARATAERLHIIREKGWWFLLDDMVAAEKLPVPQWFLDRVVATDIQPWIAFTESRPSWNWGPWDAAPNINIPTLILTGELEDPDDVMGEFAAAMPDATRIRIPDREHINAFLYSEFVAPRVIEFLASRTRQATG